MKSMMGEELNATEVADRGLLGDRAFAIVDAETGKVASAKNPRKWSALFDFRSAYVGLPRPEEGLPPVRITFPDGAVATSEDDDLERLLSEALGRPVRFSAAGLAEPSLEEYWPRDVEGLAHTDVVTEEAMPPGTFFDLAVVHVLTTATLDRLRELYPQGRFEPRRFRPNIIVRPDDAAGFVENGWVGRTVAIGNEVRLDVTGLCPRCVMTTLPQGDLPKDSGILRTAAKHNEVSVGVYANVTRGGRIRRGDAVSVE